MTETTGSLLGQQLGNYTLTRKLGAGGFAEVYLGMHRHLETQAAIKVLQAQLSQTDQQQFIAEARTVARLRHPHIVHILEFGIERDVPYLVMNYAEHGTLRGYFPRGVPLAPGAFLAYLKQIASALQYAHDQGLIHRDIKPENMLLDERDEVFLSDFGIATQARSSRSQTVEGVIGTVVYMSPEQLQGKPRPASDQYALAIVVYEWLTGTRPFRGDSYLAIAEQQITTSPRPLRERVPGLAPAVEQVVLTALSKDYHQRYACVLDFAEALEQAHLSGRYRGPQEFAPRAAASRSTPALAMSPLPVSGPTPVSGDATTRYGLAPTQAARSGKILYSRRTLIGGGLAAAVLAGGGLSWWATTRLAAGKNTGSGGQQGSGTNIASRFLTQARLVHTYKLPTKVANVAWSKDSKYVASVEGDTIVHVWNASTGEDLWNTSNVNMGEIIQIAWSPDGNSLAVIVRATDNVTIVNIFDTTSHQLRSHFALPGWRMAWSPDSKFLAVAGGGGGGVDSTLVCIWDGNTNHDPTYTLSLLDAVQALAWKPDGKELALGLTNPNGSFSWVIFWTLGGNKPETGPDKLSFNSRNVFGDTATISWSSAGNNWIASGGSTSVEIWDADSLGKSYNQNRNQYAIPAIWSPDGHFLASATTADQTIRVWNGQDLGIASTCAGHGDTITALAWSPDGRYLACTAIVNRDQGVIGRDQTVRVWQVGN